MTRYAMTFDLNRCTGCWACAIACKAENSVGEGLWWQTVETIGGPERDSSVGVFPNVQKHYQPRNCFHCDNPPCLPVCPEGAITKRPDGIVIIDYHACTGCGDCVPACPYDAIVLNEEVPKLPPGLEDGHGSAEVMPRKKGVAEKCSFCVHRIDNDLDPACVSACPTGVISFGNLDEPESDVARSAGQTQAIRMKEETGAKPFVWYMPYTIGKNQRRSGGD